MNCPKCHFKNTNVYDTRIGKNGKSTRRRRECGNCGYRFTTIEEVKILDLKVEKRNGQTVDFSEEKLEIGILKAFNKRKTDNLKIAELVQKVTDDIVSTGKNPIKSTKIGRLVLKHLKTTDEAAYVCYGAMFWNFESVDDFSVLLREVLKD
jgi:transcriptional repressor NrdR